ncbi:MAG: dihydrodipicolinate synthase family protein [candidate division KSB1 bacterium]|nr:dihydrodipicolinate synthase family protein [candidate division KSB1 bacterium]
MEARREGLFEGVVVPVFTPFTAAGAVDLETLPKLLEWLSGQKVNVFFLMGGSGEWQALSFSERKQLVDVAVHASGSIPLVPNIGCEDLRDTLRLRDFAIHVGVPAVGVVIPEAIRPSQDGILAFVSTVCRECEVPVLLYDPRGEGPRSPTPATMRRIAEEVPSVVALKYRTTDAERMARMCREVGEHIQVLSGVETVYLSDLAYGAVGVVGGGANIWPNLLAALQEAFGAGDWTTARKLQFRVIELNDGLAQVPWPTSGKLALRALGLPIEPVSRLGAKRPVPEADVRAIENLVRSCEWVLPARS